MPILSAKAVFDKPDFSRTNLYLSASFFIDSFLTSVYNLYTWCYYIATWFSCKEDKNFIFRRKLWLKKQYLYNRINGQHLLHRLIKARGINLVQSLFQFRRTSGLRRQNNILYGILTTYFPTRRGWFFPIALL